MILKIIEDVIKTKIYGSGFTGTFSSAIRHTFLFPDVILRGPHGLSRL